MGNGTELGRVRGLGASHHGTSHWTMQRITAIANLGLITWLLVSLVTGDFGTQSAVQRWLASPVAAVPLALLVISAFTHIRLGLQVLIEDYAHGEGSKLFWMLLLTFFTWGGMISALFCIVKIAIGAVSHAGQ